MPQNAKKLNSLLVLLLAVQILCTAVFPLAVRRMADIGIRQSGFKSAVPTAMREQTMEDLRLFMTPGDYKTVHDAYAVEDGVCTLSDGADSEMLNAIFAPAIRLYLRTVQRGSNAMAAVRAEMENGTITQSQLLEQARDGMPSLTGAQEIAASAAFLRAEYSVLGLNPDGIRSGYLRRISFALVGCAAAIFLSEMLSAHVRRKSENPKAYEKAHGYGTAAAALIIAVWGAVELMLDPAKPGAFAQTVLALTQLAMVFLPASLYRRADTLAPRDQGECIKSVFPAAVGMIGALITLGGASVAAHGADAVNSGLNRVISGSAASGAPALRNALLFGGGWIAVGMVLQFLAWRLDRNRKFAFSNRLGGALAVLPGMSAVIAALCMVFSNKSSLGVILLLALIAGVLVMGWVQNRRPNLIAGLVRFPGQLACAAIAGFGANLAAKSILSIGDYLLCVVCAVVCTRMTGKLLTR